MQNLNRRDFIKLGTVSAGVVGFANIPFANATNQKLVSGELGKWIATTCQGCTSWCSVEGYVFDNKLIKVRGNANAKGNHGNICPRPHLAIQQVYDKDRVKTPLKRTNPKKGKGENPKFVPISWEEATDTIADKILELINNDESHKFCLMRGRYTYMNEIIYGTFPKLIGSPNNISHSSICAEAEKFGRYYTEGFWDYADFDLENAKYILGWGADPLASNRQVPHFINIWGHVLDNATVTIIDPRLSVTAAKAHKWLPIIPGADSALAVAIAHTILVNGVWNKDFVGNFKDKVNYFRVGEQVEEELFDEIHTNGVVKWWNLELFDKTPEWAEKITGISAKDIIKTALDFANSGSRAISWVSPGAAMQVRGAYSSMAGHALNGLVGSVDAKGGILQANKVPMGKTPDIKPYMSEKIVKGTKHKKIDQRGTALFPALKKKSGGGVVTANVANAILDESPYDIKVALGYWNNFVFSVNGSDLWEKAMAKVPFFAHITTNLAETSMFADIVLPAKMHMFERYGFVLNKQNMHGYMSIHQPLIKPLADAKTDETEVIWLICQSLAKKGFDAPLRYYKENFKDPISGKEPTNEEEFDLYAFKHYTKPVWDGSHADDGDKLNSWDELLQKGVWNTKKFKPGKKIDHFKTVTKKFEFYSETLKHVLEEHTKKNALSSIDEAIEHANITAKGEKVFVPHYEPIVRYGDETEYPLIFAEHRSRLNREGRSQNVPWYYEIKDVDPGDVSNEDVAKINPLTAKKYNLKDGDKIKISSQQGEMETVVKLWEGTRPDVVVKCYGQGHWAYGTVASEKFGQIPRGGNNNAIHIHEYDRLSGSTARHGGTARIKIEKI
ncbi:molybdopterin-dependent oxidoreductase [Arcobacter sp.]|uniref:molybdopterin-dependent oxidoreductase n=1 Tax=Arcobacter sp. TaxID=1872629 RepID=UPI003D106EFA